MKKHKSLTDGCEMFSMLVDLVYWFYILPETKTRFRSEKTQQQGFEF